MSERGLTRERMTELDARLFDAASQSYRKHCNDPVAAAEGDLLGQAVGVLAEIQRIANTNGITDENASDMLRWVFVKKRMGDIDAFLAQAKTESTE